MPVPSLPLLLGKERLRKVAKHREHMRGLGKSKKLQFKLPYQISKTESLIEQPHFEYKSYFGAVAVISHSHALRLSFHF